MHLAQDESTRLAGGRDARAQQTVVGAGWASSASRRRVCIVLILLALTAAWVERDRILTAVGELLIAEDRVAAPVQLIVVSNANVMADALEAARLYGEGYGAEVLVPLWKREPLNAEIRALGIPFVGEELAAQILTRSGVPRTALHVLAAGVDGTQSEIAAVAQFASQHQPVSLLYVTSRSHTARARWLLGRALPGTTRLLVRAPRTDRLHADAWWRSREDSREVFTEYLRWFNALILRDPWARTTGTDQ